MATLLRNRRLIWMQAPRMNYRLLKMNYRLPAVTYRQYASPSTVQKQVTAAVAGEINRNLEKTVIKPISEVPGPKRLPFFGTALSMVMNKEYSGDTMHKYWRYLKRTYGDIVMIDLPGLGPIMVLFHPEDCENITRLTMKNPVREGGNSLKKVREEAYDNYFEQRPGLVASNGEEWFRVRSRVQTPMMKPKNVLGYLTPMDKVSLDFVDRIADFQEKYGEMPSNFQTEIYKWALESVCLVALNRRMGCLDPNLKKDSEPMILIREAQRMLEGMGKAEFGLRMWRYFPTPAYIKLRDGHNTFLRIADEHIRETEARLMARNSNSEEDLTLMETLLMTPGLTRKDVVTLILDLMFAGIDSTAHTVGFTLYLLAKYPKAQAKVQEELDRVLRDHQGPLTPQILGQLTYMKAALKESLRIFPLGFGTMRTLDKEAVIGGYLVPKGYIVAPFTMFSADDERWFPKAAEFHPERWLRDRPMGPIHAYASQPFGLGARMCLGRRFAEQEIYTLLTRILQRFDIDYKYNDIEMITRLVSVPSQPLRFNFTERRS